MSVVLDEFNNNKSKQIYQMLLQKFPVSVLEQTVCAYYLAQHCGMSVTEFIKAFQNSGIPAEVKDALQFAKQSACANESTEDAVIASMGIYQYGAQVERFRRSKQVYVFDKDFLSELIDTDAKFVINGDMLNTLPHRVFFLDYSAGDDLCEKMQLDGTLITVNDIHAGSDIYWLIQCVNYYKGTCKFVHCIIMPNATETLTIADLVNRLSTVYKTDVSSPEERKAREVLMFTTVMQTVLYLCSYEPDIKETCVSKQRYKDAKKQKPKDKKAQIDMPDREYNVGEYFGNSFRKHKQSRAEGSTAGTGTGKSKRPHMRSAHWHPYWYGKRNSPDRKIRVRWVHETFVNVDEKDSDKKLAVAKHKVMH